MTKQKDFVVYVNFPSSSKEYVYLCAIPNVVQGSEVIANGTKVRVVRTAGHDPRATKYVYPLPDQAEIEKRHRKIEIGKRLAEIEQDIRMRERYTVLARKSPEAKKLLNELKGL